MADNADSGGRFHYDDNLIRTNARSATSMTLSTARVDNDDVPGKCFLYKMEGYNDEAEKHQYRSEG